MIFTTTHASMVRPAFVPDRDRVRAVPTDSLLIWSADSGLVIFATRKRENF
jgi:hypothetical protein